MMLFVFAGLMSCFANVQATKFFKITNGTSSEQAINNMVLARKSNLQQIPIDPTNYTLTYPGGSISVVLPSDVTQFYYSFEVPTDTKTYSVSGSASVTPASYKLIYVASIDAMILQQIS